MVVGAAVHVNAGSLYDYIKKCIIGTLPLPYKAAAIVGHCTNRPKNAACCSAPCQRAGLRRKLNNHIIVTEMSDEPRVRRETRQRSRPPPSARPSGLGLQPSRIDASRDR